ncbi:Plasmid stabilization system protein [Nitrospira sp. KM1]|uniref:type II toxin-antitoxin system RelE family toxin n=1 Tax=Nitrospira sp. KM1 TaxID=1936990 RepID=UPI0013A7AB1F|nr:type II toxin-antitoxin system RelE/ParE family toxin [Nitrospira sp. KM1]BCA53737.1 Plasmid stabilization system protein [Nitrospira sp. KM1]
MAHSILLAPPAERQLRSLPLAIQKRLVKRIKTLQNNPRPPGVKNLADEDDLYRIHEADYRIVYTVQDKELIALVVKISDRKEAYRLQ